MRDENKIYLGNLEYGVTEEELRSVIESKGFNAVEVTVIKDKATDRSKGFGFAKFATAEEMEQAIQVLNGMEVNARALRVSKALKKTDGKSPNSRRPAYSTVE
ncbi:MAG: RNA-binding protein [Candidatus Omnitrophica bacterium]|nr:RNA-binding protein [Candidatus Omnitrophota bacterium]